MSTRLVAAALLAGATLAQAAPTGAPPAAPSHPVTDTLHGVAVPDPYRNLEDLNSPETRDWLKAQGQYAARQLSRIEGRDAMQARIQELANSAGDVVRGFVRMPGDRLYYLERKAGEPQFKLVMRQGLAGAPRVLVDPQEAAKATGVPHAINHYSPSWDGHTLAYTMSAGGSEDGSLHLLDVASSRRIGKPIPHVAEGLIQWAPDSRRLTYNQQREMPAGAPETERYMDSAVWLLDLRKPDAPPRAIFGPQVTPELKLDRLDTGGVTFEPGSRWMVARTTDTTVPEGKLFIAPVSALGSKKIAWRQITRFEDKVTDLGLHGDTLYLRTYAGAPRGRIVALDLAHPSLQRAREVAAEPAGNAVLLGFEPGRDAVFAQVREGFVVRLKRFSAGDVHGVDVVPGLPGSAFKVDEPAHAYRDVLFATSSWTEPSRVMQAEPGGRWHDTGLRNNRVPPGAPELEVREVTVPSHDGAPVPLAVLYRKGLKLDGSHPTLLFGYGSYGFSEEAHYAPTQLAWLEKGGVIAYANVRGSGVYGDAWHRAGFKTSKANTWKDGIACARWLVDQGYATPKTLAVWGGSAGGIFVGRAVTEAPELFAAGIFEVGMLDTVRSELSANGVTNISEFGTVKDAAEFKGLLEMSTYHHIREGVAYPAVMLIHGMNDPRVDVWHSAKTAALLQAVNANGKPVLLRLDEQAGHGIGSTAGQAFSKQADAYSFLLWQMGQVGLAP